MVKEMNIGCDILYNKRLKNKSTRFIELILTNNEIKDYQKYGFKYLCCAFATKEAIMKCFSNTKELNFHDIEISISPDKCIKCLNYPNIIIDATYKKEYTIAFALSQK